MNDIINESRFENLLNTSKQITDGIVIKDLVEKYNKDKWGCTDEMCECDWHPVKLIGGQ